MSNRPHRKRHHRPPVNWAPIVATPGACAFDPCPDRIRWCVAGMHDVDGRPGVGIAYVCDAHLGESMREHGTVAEPMVAPVEDAHEVIAFVEHFTGQQVIRHAS